MNLAIFLILRMLYRIKRPILVITMILGLCGPNAGYAEENHMVINPVDLSPRVYSLGGMPRATVLTDLDHDMDIDIVVANPRNHNIVILLNKGDGTFDIGDSYPVGGYPIAILARDMDNDSDTDLVVLDSEGMAHTFLNSGGSEPGKGMIFSTGGDYPVVSYAFSISPYDVDLDQDWDIIVSSATRNTILLNDGKGGLKTSLTYKGGTDSHVKVRADLNFDEREDMVIGDRDGISVLLNNGNDTFARGEAYATGEMPMALATGDMDSDLNPDIVVANYNGHTISILKNKGDGTFQEAVNYPSGKGTNSISLGDVDRDEDLDIVVTNGKSGEVYIFINNIVKPLGITTGSLPHGTRNLYYSTKLEAKGGVPPYRWEVISGALPPSLQLDPLTGEIESLSRHEGEIASPLARNDRVVGSNDIVVEGNDIMVGGDERGEGEAHHGEEMGEPLLNLGPLCVCLKAPKGLYRFTVKVTDSASASASSDLYIEVLPQPASISGTIGYPGERGGTIRIGLWPHSQGALRGLFIKPVFSAIITAPGGYKIDGILPGTYIAGAFLDVNNDGQRQRDEPYGGWSSKDGVEAIMVDEGAEIKGTDIELVEGGIQ